MYASARTARQNCRERFHSADGIPHAPVSAAAARFFFHQDGHWPERLKLSSSPPDLRRASAAVPGGKRLVQVQWLTSTPQVARRVTP